MTYRKTSSSNPHPASLSEEEYYQLSMNLLQKYNMHFLLLEPFPLEFSLTSKCSRIQGFLFKGFLFLFLTSLLVYNCFTMVGQFLLCNKVNQLQIYIYPHISSLLCLPPTLPIPPSLSHPSRWSQTTLFKGLIYKYETRNFSQFFISLHPSFS